MAGERQQRSGGRMRFVDGLQHNLLQNTFTRGLLALQGVNLNFEGLGGTESIDSKPYANIILPRGRTAVLRGNIPFFSRSQEGAPAVVSMEIAPKDESSSTIYSVSGKMPLSIPMRDIDRALGVSQEGELTEIAEYEPYEELSDGMKNFLHGVYQITEPQVDPSTFQKNGEHVTGLKGLREAARFDKLVGIAAETLPSWIAGPK